MGFSSFYRSSTPSSARHYVAGPRASTGTVELGSSYDPNESPRGRYDYDRYHVGLKSPVEARPVSSQKIRDPNSSFKKLTEYTIRPKSRQRSHTASDAALHEPHKFENPARFSVQSHSRPIITSSFGPSSSPPTKSSDHYITLASSQPSRHRRVYSTDYASDTGRMTPRDVVKNRTPSRHSMSHTHEPSGRHRSSTYDGLKKGDDIDHSDAYSYTTPREQFDRDYPIRPRATSRSSGDHSSCMNLMDEKSLQSLRVPRKDNRQHGPPPTSWDFDKLDHEGRPRSRRAVEEHRESSRSRAGHERALVALPHESDDGYDSVSDPHYHRRRRRHRRHHQEGDRHHPEERPSSRLGNEQALVGLGTAALGSGFSDVSDHERSRRHHRRPRDPERDFDATQSTTHLKSYHEPGERRRSRSRRHSRHEERFTDDEDLQKYRREPSTNPGPRHSSSDTSEDNHPGRRPPRERSQVRSPRRLQDVLHSNDSRHSTTSFDSNESRRPLTAVDPPKELEQAPKGILKPPRPSFPEEPNPVREGVAPLKDATKKGIPPGARWTKIDRRLVNPAALEAGNERFEERSNYVIVLRVLTKEEIQAYAVKTQEVRDTRQKEYIQDKRRRMDESKRNGRRGEESSSDDEDEDDNEPLKLDPPPAEPSKPTMPMRPRSTVNAMPKMSSRMPSATLA